LEQRKKILSTLIKLLIGLGSFVVIYLRLKNDFTSEKLGLLYTAAFSAQGLFSLALCLLLIPVNWGIEAFRWKLITAPVEAVSYYTATQSVYSGVCLGNLAPGRATEFLAKIIFFKPENRPRITVLHFINGLFQLSITILAGLGALWVHLNSFGSEHAWMAYVAGGLSALLLLVLCLCLYRLNPILNFVSRKLSKEKQIEDFSYPFTTGLVIQLFFLSVLRYSVFFCQMALLIYLFHHEQPGLFILSEIALYFLITTVIPMISVLEAPIRAAIALVVFRDSGISNSVLALSSVLIWLVNIIIPSIYGYLILLRQNFNFKLFASKK
jgi:hypothetical protein